MSLQQALIRTSGERNAPFILLWIPLLSLLALLVFIRTNVSGMLAVFAGFFFLVTLAWRTETYIVCLVSYLAFFPVARYAEYFGFFPVFYYSKVGAVFLFAIAATLLINRGLSPERTQVVEERSDVVGNVLILMFLWMIFEVFHGISRSNPGNFIASEIFGTLPFLGYFIWRSMFRWKGRIEAWFRFLLIVGVVVAFEYFLMVALSWQDIFTFVIQRAITRQGQLIHILIPMAAAFALTTKRRSHRVFYGAAVIIFLIQLFFTQQRALWIANAVGIFVFFTLYAFKDGFKKRGIIVWLTGIGIVSLLFFLVILTARYYFEVDLDVLFKRWRKVSKLITDGSLRMRILDVRNAWEYIKMSPLLGYGMGATIFVIPVGAHFNFLDNSFVITLLKGGVPFFALFISFYCLGLYRAWIVFRKSSDRKIQAFAIVIFSSLVAVMVSGLASINLIYYRFVFIWTMLIAGAVVLYEMLQSSDQREI